MKNNNIVIKNILFLLLFLVVLTLFLVIYIIPQLKEYKTKQAIIAKSEKIYNKNIDSLNKLKKKKELTYKRYKKNIEKYNRNFDLENFKSFVKRFFKDATINTTKYKEKLIIQTTIASKEELYNFLEKVNDYKNIVKINFPLVYKIVNGNKIITINVTISNINLKNNLKD